MQGRSTSALALYLFLVTVADADGLSWYSEDALCRQLSCSGPQLESARSELEHAELIAYRKPLYQVLDLTPVPMQSPTGAARTSPRRNGEPVAIGTILKHMLGGVQ
jgi:hypothetical protein